MIFLSSEQSLCTYVYIPFDICRLVAVVFLLPPISLAKNILFCPKSWRADYPKGQNVIFVKCNNSNRDCVVLSLRISNFPLFICLLFSVWILSLTIHCSFYLACVHPGKLGHDHQDQVHYVYSLVLQIPCRELANFSFYPRGAERWCCVVSGH